jgi:hypothetical protein
MNSCRLVGAISLVLPVTKNIVRKVTLSFLLCWSAIASEVQVAPTHSQPAMQCVNTSNRDSGDVLVTNLCNFKITFQASTAEGTQSVRNLDPGGSGSIAASAHNPWRVFACEWPGVPADETGKEVTYITVKYQCPVQTAVQGTPQPSQAADEVKAEETKFYADAHPYMDQPLPELKKVVHELSGLKPAASQDSLPDLLAKVAAKADELLMKVPDLISDEAVQETQWTVSQGPAPCIGTGCLQHPADSFARRDQSFTYLILAHQKEDRRLLIEEYRTSRNGKPIPQGTEAPQFQGFVSSWIVFSSLNRVESRFRYLGEQKTDGHNTVVVGFAQVPGAIEQPGKILSEKGAIPILLQGVAWFDQSDFRIVRLRTDLLAAQPLVEFQKLTADILFGPVQIAGLDSALWLPQTVDAEMEANGQHLQEQHRYSKYRLYQARSRIVLSPEN